MLVVWLSGFGVASLKNIIEVFGVKGSKLATLVGDNGHSQFYFRKLNY